ncbi:hypothetical protein BGZ58_002266 [Dissophora ornata]|nr:hypothetical protein BGZ58_002266 [Dissophora ornata]
MAATDQPSIPLYQQRILVAPLTATLPASAASRSSSRFASPASSPSLASTKSFSDPTPQKTFLPRNTLRSSPDHGANIHKLLSFQECFRRREFWEESAILERMYYKNKSQHRQAGYFQRLCECRRLVSRIKELDIAGLVDELVKKFYSCRSLKTLLTMKNQWDSIPYRSTVAFTMTRIIGAILLLRKMQSALHETYGAFYQLMSKTQFMSFALIAIGLCSRLSLVSKAWMNELVDCYEFLGTWVKSFPKENLPLGAVDYEKQLPESINSLITTNLPEIPNILPVSVSSRATEQASIMGSDMGQVVLRKERTASQASMGGSDLGEVIQRKEPSTTPNTFSSPRPLQESLPPSLETNNDRDISETVMELDSAHTSLLGELDTVFGKKVSTSSAKPGYTKEPSSLLDLDQIFGDRKKHSIKEKKKLKKTGDSSASPSPSSSSVLTPGTGPKKKSTGGSASNFDNISKFDQDSTPPRGGSKAGISISLKSGELAKKAAKDKKEIDNIFEAIKTPKKKLPGSEIDEIFGPPSKKKKKKIAL